MSLPSTLFLLAPLLTACTVDGALNPEKRSTVVPVDSPSADAPSEDASDAASDPSESSDPADPADSADASAPAEVETGPFGRVVGAIRSPFVPTPGDLSFQGDADATFDAYSFAGDDFRTGGAKVAAVPGEILVRLRDDAPAQRGGRHGDLRDAGFEAGGAKPGRIALWRSDKPMTSDETIALAEAMSARPDVESATPNWILETHSSHTPAAYALQWHYPALGLHQAWAVEDGTSSPITVAVLDTGYQDHADLRGAWLPGYDFINLDSDPTDGGNPNIGYISHGTHVAGTIAMKLGNDPFVAGVSRGASVVPVKVLADQGGGTLSKMLAGIVWASGLDVPGYAYPASYGDVPRNPNPARVINMSLGARVGGCPDLIADVTSYLASQGVVLIASAGNDGLDTDGVVPASCPGVVAVGATGLYDDRAWYSNYGPRIDVYAPGGDFDDTLRAVGFDQQFGAGVLSTTRLNDNPDGYVFMQGTSMAAPHVAGVAALLLANDPSMSAEDVAETLRGATRPMSAAQCDRPDAIDCAGGRLDAALAFGVETDAGWAGAPTVRLTLSRCDDAGCATGEPLPTVRSTTGALTRSAWTFDLGDVGVGTYRLDATIEAPGTPWPVSAATQQIVVTEDATTHVTATAAAL